MNKLNYSLALNTNVCDFHHKTTSWEELVALLSAPPATTENRDLWATQAVATQKHSFFCPSHFRPLDDPNVDSNRFGYRRSNQNVLGKNILVLDIDNDPTKARPELTIVEAIRFFSEYEFLIYTTYNHLNPAKGNKEKFRIVFPLSAYLTSSEWASIKLSLKQKWPFADPASFTLSQGFFLPVTHPDRKHQYAVHANSGKWLDINISNNTATPPTIKTTSTDQKQNTQDPIGIVFKLDNGESILATDLFNRLDDGYENRVRCFALSRFDKHPDCFIYRHGNSLCLFDNTIDGITRFPMYTAAPAEDELNRQVIVDFVAKHKKTKPSNNPLLTPPLIEYPEQSTVIRLDCRYLSNFPNNSLPKQGMVFIKSPKGTGKTELMKQFVNEAGSRVLLIGHRVSLLSSLAERLDLVNYQDTNSVPDRLAISLDSLTRLSSNRSTATKPYDTIFIDESEQVLRHLTSETLKKRRSEVFSTLICLVRGAKRVVCLDADLTYELTIDLLIKLRGQELGKSDDLIGYLNEFRYSDREIDIYPSSQQLLADLLGLVDNNGRAFVATNGREFAEKLEVIIAKRQPKAKVIVISSRTRDFSEVKKFHNNPTHEATKYDFVIATPSMGTGTSIDTKEHFNAVYGFFSQRPSTYQDCDQAISRVREALPTKVWIQASTNPKPPRTEQYLYEIAIEREKTTRMRLPGELPKFTRGEWLWFEVYARLSYLEECWLHQKRDLFIELKEDSGFTVNHIPDSPDCHAKGKAAIEDADHDAIRLEVEAIIAAKDISQEEADSTNKKQVKTRDEELSLNKFFIKKLLGSRPLNFSNVYQAHVKKVAEKRKRVKQALSPINDLEVNDRDERMYSKHAVTDHSHRTKQIERFNELCAVAKLDYRKLLSQANQMVQAMEKLNAAKSNNEPRTQARREAKSSFDATTADIDLTIHKQQLTAIATHYAKNLHDYNLFFGCRIKDPTKEENQMKAWNATFGYFGIPLCKRKKGPRGAQFMVYKIDVMSNALLFDLAVELINN